MLPRFAYKKKEKVKVNKQNMSNPEIISDYVSQEVSATKTVCQCAMKRVLEIGYI